VRNGSYLEKRGWMRAKARKLDGPEPKMVSFEE
jgi:hypothetical protein